MKCPSCKYENRYVSETVETPVYYKSGKRKGEVKEIVQEKIEFYKTDRDFIEIETEKNVDEFVINKGSWGFRDTINLYACPECGTVVVKEINEGLL